MRYSLLAGAILTLSGAALAQERTADLAFDTASVKKAVDSGLAGVVVDGGRLTATTTVSNLLRLAFGLNSNKQILGLPDWANAEMFAVIGVPPAGAPSSSRQLLAMLRTLLRTRFALRAHVEAREAPIYVLAMAREDRRTGPGLRPSTFDCREFIVGAGGSMNVSGPCPILARESRTPGLAGYTLNGRSMEKFATDLRMLTDRPVRNQTQLPGIFDVQLEFSRETRPDAETVSIFTAVREQLGLKLEPSRGAVEMLVIDHIERPTEN